MARYLVIRQSDGLVTNAVEWDGISSWSPPDGHTAMQSDTGAVGQTWDGATFIDPPPPPPPAIGKLDRLIAILAAKRVGSVDVLTAEEVADLAARS